MKLNFFNFFNFNFNFLNKNKYKFEEYNIDEIYTNEYVIFLTKYDIKSKFFTKHNILNFYIHDKDKILEIINEKNNSLEPNPPTNSQNPKNIHKIFFYDNNIEANVLYKKIKFSLSHLFVPITIYSIKKMDFKIRTLCQIAEKLGAEKIDISYKNFYYHKKDIDTGLKYITEGINLSNSEVNKDNENLNILMTYSKNSQKYNLNMNKYSLYITVELENELFITKKDFDADIDLQFLVESRCNNFINDYNTNLTINKFNSYETDILLKAKNIGFNFDISSIKDETISISINIKFLNIYDNYSCINGDNLTPSKNSFSLLYGFINEEKKFIKENESNKNKINNDELINNKVILLYSKIINYYRIYFKYLSKNFVSLKTRKKKYTFDINIYNKFNNILLLHFNTNELNTLFYKLFDNVYDSYYKFKIIRNKIIFGIESFNEISYNDNKEDILINKFNFLCYYYNHVEKTKKFITNNVALYYSKIMFDYIPYLYLLEFYKIIFIDDNFLFTFFIFLDKEIEDKIIIPKKYFQEINKNNETIKEKYDKIIDFFKNNNGDSYSYVNQMSEAKISFLMSLGFETKFFVDIILNNIKLCRELLTNYLDFIKNNKNNELIYLELYNKINKRYLEVNECVEEWFKNKNEFTNFSKKLIEELFNNNKLITSSLNNSKEDIELLIENCFYNVGILSKSINEEVSNLLWLKNIGSKKYLFFSGNKYIFIDYIIINSITIINYLFENLNTITMLYERNTENACEDIFMNKTKIYLILERTQAIVFNIINKYFEKKNLDIEDYEIQEEVSKIIDEKLFFKNYTNYKIYFTYENIQKIIDLLINLHIKNKK